jgi:hypothetical protein
MKATTMSNKLDISLTGADHSYELSLIIEVIDEGLDEGRLRNSVGTLQATWDNNGVVFSLNKVVLQYLNELPDIPRMDRKKKAYGIIGWAELRERYIRYDADATRALSDI